MYYAEITHKSTGQIVSNGLFETRKNAMQFVANTRKSLENMDYYTSKIEVSGAVARGIAVIVHLPHGENHADYVYPMENNQDFPYGSQLTMVFQSDESARAYASHMLFNHLGACRVTIVPVGQCEF